MSDTFNIYELIVAHCQDRVKFTKQEFDQAKFKTRCLPIQCTVCKQVYQLSKQDFYKIIKYNKPEESITKLDVCGSNCKSSLQHVKGTCPNCGIVVIKTLSDYNRYKTFFCSQSCAASYNNKRRSKQTRDKQRKTLKNTLKKKQSLSNNRNVRNASSNKSKKVKRCIVCGSIKGQCPRPDVCSSGLVKQRSNNLALLGFDFSCYGTLAVIEQFDKIKKLLHNLYDVQEQSIWSIMKLYKIPSERTFVSLFKTFGIQSRSKSESQKISLINNRRNLISSGNSQYKRGYHTTWEGLVVYYRSSYELDYCIQLDEQNISYDMEVLRLKYFDTIKNSYRVAVPDFYIASENKIVEIKSYRTYNRQNMIDKSKAYQDMGYKFELVLEHVSYGATCPPDKPKIRSNQT